MHASKREERTERRQRERERRWTRVEDDAVLDCTHSAAKRATNLHTFTLHGFCYPVRPSLSLSLSDSLVLVVCLTLAGQSERAVELGWGVSIYGCWRPFYFVGWRAAPFLPRGLPIKRSPRIWVPWATVDSRRCLLFRRGQKERLLRFNRLRAGAAVMPYDRPKMRDRKRYDTLFLDRTQERAYEDDVLEW